MSSIKEYAAQLNKAIFKALVIEESTIRAFNQLEESTIRYNNVQLEILCIGLEIAGLKELTDTHTTISSLS